jgi:nucleoid-associated protein EbfC
VNPFGDPRKLMKQMQQMQERLQQEIAAISVEATSGGGMVKVEMDGLKALRTVTIDPEVVSKEDVAMLQDLIVAAVNEAARKVDEAVAEKTSSLAGSLPKIPGLF